MQIKKKILDDCNYPQTENAFITYPFEVFIRMLEMFAYRRDIYSGVRAYLASYICTPGDPCNGHVPSGAEGKLTLVFVPTTSPDGHYHKDDTSNCYTICDGRLIRLPDPKMVPSKADTASNWIRNYQQNRIPQLEADGRRVANNTNYQETRSLWYSMDSIAGDGHEEVGLTSYARCMSITPDDPNNPVDGVILRFSCFVMDDDINSSGKYPYYRLTVIFDLHQKNDPPETGISFGSGQSTLSTTVPTDTGLPCPPDVGCGGGSLLPIS
jgi:hypothetical protein